MEAVVCTELGPPDGLAIGVLPDPVPGYGQIAIEVVVAGFNFPDLLIIEGRYQFRAEPPFAPGGEAAGFVVDVGPGVEGFSPGDRVTAFGPHGAFATTWIVDAAVAVHLPDDISFEAAAASTMTHGTAYHALVDRAGVRAGETVLVLGAAGGVGSAALQVGRALGPTVIAAAGSEDKLAFCRSLGADATVDYVAGDLRAALGEATGGRGVDVIVDPVGGIASEAAFRSIAWNGRHLVVGFASGGIPSIPLNLPLLKGASIVGVFWGSFAMRDPEANRANAEAIFALMRAGEVEPPIMEVLPFGRFREGFELMASRSVRGKVLLAVAER
jgi:NADPH2:quinone reductase